MTFDSSSKMKHVDEEPRETDDDVHAVHDVPDDGQDAGDGGVESGGEDGAAKGIGTKLTLLDEVTITGVVAKGKMLVEQRVAVQSL
jgi:hypothetical protein